MFFAILLGLAVIAAGIGVTFGGVWATVGAVVLMAIGAKVLFMGVGFGLCRRRARTGFHENWGPGGKAWRGPRPFGPHSEHIRARMDEWHEQAHAAADAPVEDAPAAE